MKAKALRRITVITADLDRIVAFHAEAAGFVAVGNEAQLSPRWGGVLGVGRGRRRVMRLGAQQVEFVSPEQPGAPYPAGSTASDLWFQHMALVVQDIDAAHAQVMAAGAVPISTDGPVQLPPGAGAVRAFKFRDPDGHPLELLWFPEGTGDARWHMAGGPLFRGIDHSAIAVRDAAASSLFYEQTLGLKRTAASVNQGPAQVRLDAVPDDVVDVVALSPEASTPHVELLGYRVGTRRPVPPDAKPTDIAATRLVFTLAPTDAGTNATSLSDPDGHRLVVLPADQDMDLG